MILIREHRIALNRTIKRFTIPYSGKSRGFLLALHWVRIKTRNSR